MWILGPIAIVGVLGAILIAHSFHVTPGDEAPRITRARFEQIDPGMTQQQVYGLIGPGTPDGESRTESGTYTTETWRRGSVYISVTFRNGLVSHAYQSGL